MGVGYSSIILEVWIDLSHFSHHMSQDTGRGNLGYLKESGKKKVARFNESTSSITFSLALIIFSACSTQRVGRAEQFGA